MLTAVQLAALKPPAGWTLSAPTLRTAGRVSRDPGQAWTLSSASKRLDALRKWAVENDLGLEYTNYAYISQDYDDTPVMSEFKVHANSKKMTLELFGVFGETFPCHTCGTASKHSGIRCTNSKCNVRHGCAQCSISGAFIRQVNTAKGRTIRLCNKCSPVCTNPGCTHRVYKAEFGKQFTGKCINCSPVAMCFACSSVGTKDTMKEVIYRGEKRTSCARCHEIYCCPVCNTYKKGKITTVAEKRMCTACATVEIDKKRVLYEKFDPAEVPAGGSMLIPSLPERPFRLISIETEVDGDKDILSGTMFRCGIVRVPEIESYSSYPSNDTEWAVHLKHDGSVTGGELISHCLNLDTKEHADVFFDVLKKLKSLKTLGKIEYNANCGGHIHIDAHNFGFGDVWRLLTVWNYLEDVIYRLAGAGHEYGHRTLVPGHDRANNGHGYANGTIKGPFGTKGVVGSTIRTQARMSGLNFTPYLSAIAQCLCGEFSANGDGRNCSCSLAKATIEWRVWNSQGNPRILHAWIAFMQAMHSYADQGEDPDAAWEKQFPSFPYTKKAFASCNSTHHSTTYDRLEWIFRNLVFTNDERDSLIYTIKQSELSDLGTVKINSLAKIVPSNAFPIKAVPRNPAKRKVPIVVNPPKDGKEAAERAATERLNQRNVMYNAIVGNAANVVQGWR